jgi:hypothetical protein
MNEAKRLKSTDKIEAIQAFCNDEANGGYKADSIKKGFISFLALDKINLANIDTSSALHNMVNHFHNESKGISRYDDFEAIDYNQTTNSDIIEEALEPIKGVMFMLSVMAMDKSLEGNQYQRQSYDVLYDTCASVLKKFDELKTQIDYMEDNLRDG